MLDDHAPEPAWRRAETYRPLLGADPSVWALEFGRRAAPRPGEGARALALADLCLAAAGPAGDPVPVAIWRRQADPSLSVVSVAPAHPGDPDALDLTSLALPVMVVRTDDGEQQVVVADGIRRLRFAVEQGDVLAGTVVCHLRFPPRSSGVAASVGLGQLIGLRDHGRLPRSLVRAGSKTARWLQILRALDARRAGASQRDIAVLLFGEARVREDWSGASDYMRMRVQRLVRAAEHMVDGGYRALGGLRAWPGTAPRVLAIWRSPAWRGHVLSLLVGAGCFLGASSGLTQPLHVACRLW